ncbi:RDD family protein [Dactylosporangium darangshiense]|uniref:RDD domain-containing protein n=1 Tax=Dactylosporangium darangshiense TaxID=579108 RepID=A0ABP8D8L7_9ACTN
MNYASWIQRVGATIVDFIPFAVIAGIGGAVDSDMGAVFWIFYLIGLVYLIFNRWYLGGQGATIGKKALGLRLISEQSGQPIGMAMAFVRDICHFVDSIICYIGYLFPLWDAKRQTIADKIVKTVVIKAA